MDTGIQLLETKSADDAKIDDATVKSLVDEYKGSQQDRPLWHLVQDVQRQAMVYMNIIDQAKLGKPATEIIQRFESELDLVPTGTLPNPTLSGLVDKAFKKISKYREILVKFTQRHSMDLLDELQFGANLSTNVQVDIGFPPSLSLGVVHLEVGAQGGIRQRRS